MTQCPACSQPVTPNDQACPKCGISLHHDEAGGGQASALGSSSSPLIAILGIGFVGVVFLLLCGGGLFWYRMGAMRPVYNSAAGSAVTGNEIFFVETSKIEGTPDEAPGDQGDGGPTGKALENSRKESP